jgi:hypothetical protein
MKKKLDTGRTLFVFHFANTRQSLEHIVFAGTQKLITSNAESMFVTLVL